MSPKLWQGKRFRKITILCAVFTSLSNKVSDLEKGDFDLGIQDSAGFQLLYNRLDRWITHVEDLAMPSWREATGMYVVGLQLGLVPSHLTKIRQYIMTGILSNHVDLEEAFQVLLSFMYAT